MIPKRAKSGTTRKSRPLPEPLTPDEVKALLKIPNKRYRTGLRNLCMMRLMLDAGLRASEVLHLLPRDVDLNTGRVFVREGKGKKDRVVWLNEASLVLLREWRERRADGKFLFCTIEGKELDSRYLRAMVARCGKKAEIERRVHPHLLRHTFASDLLRESGNLSVVQKALGHAHLTTTEIYLHIADSEVEEAMKGFRKDVD